MAKGKTFYTDYGEVFVTVEEDRSERAERTCGSKIPWKVLVKNRKTGKTWKPSVPLCVPDFGDDRKIKRRAYEAAMSFYESPQRKRFLERHER